MTNPQLRGTPELANANGTATCVARFSGGTFVTYYVTDITASTVSTTGTAALLCNGTALWRGVINNTTISQQFSQPITCTTGTQVQLVVSGTTNTYAVLGGFSIYNPQ